MRPYRPATSYNVAIGATSAASSNAFPFGVTVVRLIATSDCYVKFAASPTADTTTSLLLKNNVAEYFHCVAGNKVAVIQATAAGSLNVTEMIL